jgi:hypothetical protein
VENIDYSPISLEDLKIRIKEKIANFPIDAASIDANV